MQDPRDQLVATILGTSLLSSCHDAALHGPMGKRARKSENDVWVEQLDDVIRAYEELLETQDNPGRSGRFSYEREWTRILVRARAVVERVGAGSMYELRCHQMAARIEAAESGMQKNVADELMGVVKALRDDVAKGFLKNLRELIHGSFFDDFLEMAQHLLEQGYKDAAAALVGGSLEEQLRQMCRKADIPIEVPNGKGGMKPKPSEMMNTDLYKHEVYPLSEQKSVTAWLGLRNDAAHGDREKYDSAKVGLMIDWLRYFIAKYPA